MLEELHPTEKTPVYVAYPYLKPLTSSCCYRLPYCVPVLTQEERDTLESNKSSTVDDEN